MATLVSFHAHPDDEAIAAGGTLAKASAEGHRVVVVFATKGERGSAPEGLLEPGESLAERRAKEAMRAAGILGVHRLEFLGYRDSGMMGDVGNQDPRSFWRADIDEAADRLAAILQDERADVVTVYDETGVTGHPDHLRVHAVGTRAAHLAATPRIYEVTLSRSQAERLVAQAMLLEAIDTRLDVDLGQFGTPDEVITTVVDVGGHLEQKRRAIAAHASQVSETSFFLKLPPDTFSRLWGREYFLRQPRSAVGKRETTLFSWRSR
jgi:LmbE family N-acetylglucosaminyl deacetylase